jgi:murein DD-endopeptidase MepM/ murein hydrolase activator NlpD
VPTHKTKMYRYASVFGNRLNPITKQREFHNGLDISTRIGIPVVATANGVITEFRYDRRLGRTVQIRHEATQIETLYGHLGKYAPDIRVQKKVKRGELIGFIGNSGHSAEPHLHYGVYVEGEWKDPMDYIVDNPKKR